MGCRKSRLEKAGPRGIESYRSTMIRTVELSPNGGFQLPKEFCEKNNIKAGMSLRVVDLGKALYVTPQEEPSVEELEKLIAESGAPDREPTAAEAKMVEDIIAEIRREKQSR